MAILDKIKGDMFAARVSRAATAGTLTTLMGEIQTKEKSFTPARAISDDEVVAVVKKFLKNIDETIRLLDGTDKAKALETARAERSALEIYLPAQMSEAELEAFAKEKAANGANMGQIMGALKTEHTGKYDGKLASGIVKQVLAAA